MDTRIRNFGLASAAVVLSSLLGGCMLMHARDGGCMGGHGDEHAGAAVRAVCPVCGTALKVDERTPRASHGGQLYYFASEDHLREFLRDPSRFPSQQPDGSSGATHDGHGGKP